MIISFHRLGKFIVVAVLLFAGAFATIAYANHSWGSYHWARKTNPFTVKLGDNVSTAWDAYLGEASSDWSKSSVLDTTIVTGNAGNPRLCRATTGRAEVCNSKYGFNGWLGVASIWVSGSHFTKGTVKVNDSYFNTATYNTPPWRRLVMCQEIGHTFGLNHQDENFSTSTPNLGTCMDYTSDPDGPPSNEHPNAHDYEQLETIYSHFDAVTTVGQTVSWGRGNVDNDEDVEGQGRSVRKDGNGRTSLFERDLGKGEKVFTFIFWVE